MKIELNRTRHLKCIDKAARMVVVSMTQDDCINRFHADFQLLSVMLQCKALSRIEQQRIPISFDKEGDPVLRQQAGSAYRVFDQLCDC